MEAKEGGKGNAWKEWRERAERCRENGRWETGQEGAKGRRKRNSPRGGKLSKAERNSAIANGPRSPAKKAMCRGRNSHGGCRFGNRRFNPNETMAPQCAHWCVKAEMIRRMGFAQEKRTIPIYAGCMIRVLRESNLRIPGGQRSGQGQQVGLIKESHVFRNWAIKNGEGALRFLPHVPKKTGSNNPSPSAP